MNTGLFISISVSLACFGEPPCALAAGRAVPPDETGGNAAEAAGLSDGRPQGEPVRAVRAVGAAPRPRISVPRQRFCLRAALPAGTRPASPQPEQTNSILALPF